MRFIGDFFRVGKRSRAIQELEHKAKLTPPVAGVTVPAYLQDIIDAVSNWETDFEDLLPLSFRQYLDHLHAPLRAIDDARLEIALEGQQISDEIISRFPDLVRRSLSQDHPLTVVLIEDGGR